MRMSGLTQACKVQTVYCVIDNSEAVNWQDSRRTSTATHLPRPCLCPDKAAHALFRMQKLHNATQALLRPANPSTSSTRHGDLILCLTKAVHTPTHQDGAPCVRGCSCTRCVIWMHTPILPRQGSTSLALGCSASAVVRALLTFNAGTQTCSSGQSPCPQRAS